MIAIIVDVGLAFPEENSRYRLSHTWFTLCLDNRHKLRKDFLTRSRTIGSLSWLLRDVKCPIYGGMTIELFQLNWTTKVYVVMRTICTL